MKRLRSTKLASLFLGALLVIGTGCGDDSSSGTNNNNNTITDDDGGLTDGTVQHDGTVQQDGTTQQDGTVTTCQTPADCDDSDACTTDSCDNGTCSNVAVDPNDNDACTTDTCDPVTGVANTAVDPDDGDACTTDTCDPTTGVANTPIDPDDGDACTTDTCDPTTGVANTPIDPDDSNLCTTDTCDPATGVVNTPIDPDDSNVCTTDTCDPVLGVVNTPIDPDDSNACTADTCDPVTGVANTPIDPNDGNPCTLDSCDPALGVSNDTSIVLFTEDFADNSQGWILGPEWEIGSATASTGGWPGADPDTDHTPTADNGVAGVVIGGNADTSTTHGYYYLESPVINASVASGYVVLSYWRWLNSDYDPYMHNVVEVFDGAAWVPLWTSGPSPAINDSPPNGGGWVQYVFDITTYANPALAVRFGFDIASSGVFTTGSWNVDDVEITNTAQPADDDPCTVDGCDPASGATYTPLTADDGNPCTDTNCNLDRAVYYSATDPDDGNACTADSCDPATGIVNTPIDPDDGNACTTDSCDPATGVLNDPIVCDDGNACTVDSCDPATGCTAGAETPQPHDKCDTGTMLVSGCSDQCITDVCAVDSFCCDTSWDGICVGEVYSVCDSKSCDDSAGTCTHNLCDTGPALVTGCDSSYGDCVTQICAVDSYCCNTYWDGACVSEVASVCGLNCN